MSTKYPGGLITKSPVVPSGPTGTNTAPGIWTLEQAAYYRKLGQWPGQALDPYFNSVSLLLHGDGTNGAQNNTFLDSSTNNFAITRNGNTTQGTFTPFSQAAGYWGNYFVRANSQYLTVSNSTGNFSFGTGAFTIECWVNPSSLPSGAGYPTSYWLFGGGLVNSDTGIEFYINNAQVGFNLTAFSTPTVIGNHGMIVGNWYHVAVIRGGTSNQTLSIYVNGIRVATASSVTATADAATTGIAISAAEPSGATSGNFDGYISNYRVVKGAAVYDPTQTTLTVPTAPLIAITNTSLLTCQSNRFVDNSTNNFTLTANGNVAVQPFSPFAPTAAYSTAVNGGSGYFDGTGDYLTAPSNAAFNFGTSDFTVEAWVFRNTSTTNYETILGFDISGGLLFQIFQNELGFGIRATADNLSGVTVPSNAWVHLAISRQGSTAYMFQNGQQVSTFSNSTNFTNSTAAIISGYSTSAGQLNGYIANLRVVKGTAVYTANFTPPTAPVTAISGTSLLTNFTNAGIFDNAMKNDLETVGNAQISTAVVKYGTGSMAFDGTGDVCAIINNPWMNFGSGNWTIEFWAYANSTGRADVVSKGNSSTYCPYLVQLSGGVVSVFLSDNGTGYSLTLSSSAGAYSTSNWVHIAAVRNGNTVTIYSNGTLVGSSAYSGTPYAANTQALGIGGASDATQVLNGYIDDLRITKGVARYTANFTPPTAAFPNQ